MSDCMATTMINAAVVPPSSPTATATMFSPTVLNILNQKDSRWLTLEVCREQQRGKCPRNSDECRYAHPPAGVEVNNGRVTCCFDSIKGKCQRKDPPCKYLHPPPHLREKLIENGRNNLIQKNLQIQAATAALQQQQLGFVPVPSPYMSSQLTPAPAYIAATATTPSPVTSLTQSGGASVTGSCAVTGTAGSVVEVSANMLAQPPLSVSPGSMAAVVGSQQTQQAAAVQQPLTVIPSGASLTAAQAAAAAKSAAAMRPDRLEVCREFQRGTCKRSTSECRFAHPPDHVTVDPSDNHVTVCMDFVNGRCGREKCKYYHPHPHLQIQIKAQQQRAALTQQAAYGLVAAQAAQAQAAMAQAAQAQVAQQQNAAMAAQVAQAFHYATGNPSSGSANAMTAGIGVGPVQGSGSAASQSATAAAAAYQAAAALSPAAAQAATAYYQAPPSPVTAAAYHAATLPPPTAAATLGPHALSAGAGPAAAGSVPVLLAGQKRPHESSVTAQQLQHAYGSSQAGTAGAAGSAGTGVVQAVAGAHHQQSVAAALQHHSQQQMNADQAAAYQDVVLTMTPSGMVPLVKRAAIADIKTGLPAMFPTFAAAAPSPLASPAAAATAMSVLPGQGIQGFQAYQQATLASMQFPQQPYGVYPFALQYVGQPQSLAASTGGANGAPGAAAAMTPLLQSVPAAAQTAQLFSTTRTAYADIGGGGGVPGAAQFMAATPQQLAAAAAASQAAAVTAATLPSNVYSVNYYDDNGQLLDTLPVCKDFRVNQCKRDAHCKYIHLLDENVELSDGRVTVCRDFVKGTCLRMKCKYYHIPLVISSAVPAV